MGKNKMIAKSCPKCDQQVAVATKICKCGHCFFSAKSRLRASALGNSTGSGSTGGSTGGGVSEGGRTEGGRRRTGRVRRARPHFYDSQDYQRAPNKRRSVSQGSLEEERVRDRSKDSSKDSATAQRAARRRALKLRCPGPESRPQRGTAEAPPHPARLQRCATLLQEINRKMAAVTWSPD